VLFRSVYDRQMTKGKTPNQAIKVAYENTERSLGKRPELEAVTGS